MLLQRTGGLMERMAVQEDFVEKVPEGEVSN